MSNFDMTNTFPLDPTTPIEYLDDYTSPGPYPPADLDALSPFPTVISLAQTPHHPTSSIEALASTFTPFDPSKDPDVAAPSLPDLILPVTIAPPALDPALEPACPPKTSPALVTIAVAPAAASPVTPAIHLPSPAGGRKPTARGRRAKSRRPPRKQEKIELPTEWERIRETMNSIQGEVPDAVVQALFHEIREKAQESATQEKLKLREQLKNSANGQHGSSAEISSRREARVSRKFQEQFKEGVEVQLRDMVTKFCQLWWAFEKSKGGASIDGDPASPRKEESDVMRLCEAQGRMVKRQRLE